MPPRRSKARKGPYTVRIHLAENVRALRDRKYPYPEYDNETARNRQLAKEVDCSPSQIQRIVAGELGTSVDTIEDLARVFATRPQDLITPWFTAQARAEEPPPARPPPARGRIAANAGPKNY